MERLVRKGAFTQERADEILDMLIDELSEQSIEAYSQSAGFQNVIESLLRPQLSPKNFISLTELAREENRDNPSYVTQSWLRSRNTIEFLRLWEKENNPDFNEAECDQLFEELKKPSLHFNRQEVDYANKCYRFDFQTRKQWRYNGTP